MTKQEDPSTDVCEAAAAAMNPVSERADRELRLTFADFMPYLAESLLNADAVRGDAELIFDLEMVGELVTSGCRNVPVAALRERVPTFFRDGSLSDKDAVIDLPWKKIQRLLEAVHEPGRECASSEARSLTPGGARFLASFFCARRTEARLQRVQNPVAPGVESFLRNAGASKAFPPAQPPRSPFNSSPSAGKSQAPIEEPADSEAELSPTKLRKQRDLARHELARFKQESDRRIAALQAQLKEVTAERNDALAALAASMGDENNRLTELELENVVQRQKLERALAELEPTRSRPDASGVVPAAAESSAPSPASVAVPLPRTEGGSSGAKKERREGGRSYAGWISAVVGFCVLLGAIGHVWSSSLRARIAASEGDLHAAETDWTIASGQLQEAEKMRPKIEALVNLPTRIAEDRQVLGWTPLLQTVAASSGPETVFQNIHARGTPADPGACELRIEGTSTGQSPRSIAERFRQTLQTRLSSQFRAPITV